LKTKNKQKKKIIQNIIKIQPSGKGIILYNNEEYKVDRKKINKALDGDNVLLKILTKKKKNKAEVIKIIKRSNKKYLGILKKSNKYGFVLTKNKNIYTDFFIEKENLKKYKDKEKVLVKFKFWNFNEDSPTGEIIESLGTAGETNTEVHSILHEYGLPYSFDKEIIKEANNVKEKISKKEIEKRKDFRKKMTFTIDPKDAKDFDDAISFEKNKDNNFEIGIHIADVTHYIKPNTIIDEEAKNRANSTYLVDRVIPMLPEKLSNNLCSLRPNENKLCFSFIFEINKKEEIIKRRFEKTIINSNYRFSYEEVQNIIENRTKKISKRNSLIGKEYVVNEKAYQAIITLNELSKKLRKERIKKGSINFDKQELKFLLDPKNKPISIVFKESKESHKLIEEYMLLANKNLGELIKKTKREFIYRIHDRPDNEKLENLKIIVKKLGYKLNTKPNKVGISLNKLLNEIKGKKEQNLIDKLALRSMSKAEYSNKNIGHYGLSFENYTHFTSPIRRYSDILTHRILEQELNNERTNNKTNLENICKHISKMEQLSVKAERASNKFMQTLYMNDKIGNKYKGIISGVTERGVYVEIIENKCEGMINVKNMKGDYYVYKESTHSLIGEKSKRRYKLGDVVYIKVKKVNVLKRHLDFELLK
jgi:ribonuclease R/exosome complex exonuclease DIS3/RRP44